MERSLCVVGMQHACHTSNQYKCGVFHHFVASRRNPSFVEFSTSSRIDPAYRVVSAYPKTRQSTSARIDELAHYVRRYGHADVPLDHSTGLGRWAAQQRIKWKQGTMSVDTYRSLCALKFSFDLHDASWLKKFSRLVDYHSQHGHCEVHHEEDPELYSWLLVQRQLYRQGCLKYERAKQLDRIGFVRSILMILMIVAAWNIHAYRWEKRYLELEKFVNDYGHANIPTNVQRYRHLASWLRKIKAQWRTNDSKTQVLTSSQEARLKKLGVDLE